MNELLLVGGLTALQIHEQKMRSICKFHPKYGLFCDNAQLSGVCMRVNSFCFLLFHLQGKSQGRCTHFHPWSAWIVTVTM